MIFWQKLETGKTYAGKSGPLRTIISIEGFEIKYRAGDSQKVRECWCTTFEAWAVSEVKHDY